MPPAARTTPIRPPEMRAFTPQTIKANPGAMRLAAGAQGIIGTLGNVVLIGFIGCGQA
jgi:hypothetical protein